ncbi:MAG TPA: glycosyltransferase family A protein [Thermoanaerobaculia bacterium]|nr:glycosyltransferase family A protein [Thermoanaerobaculia bacterium]
MSPRVTVLMATYNWSSVLPYSIASALGQSFTDFELLVIGDGCTDDSEQVVRGIEDPRVQWINIPRHGHQSGPNNEGIRRARGEFIAYLGHDDLWLPHHLAVLVEALDAGADVAHTTVALVGPDGQRHAGTLLPSSTAHRRSMIDVIGVWRDYRELKTFPEMDLWQRAREAGMRFTLVPRLTGIKIVASARRGIYQERPAHEQAAWLARIRSEPDLEMTELVSMALREASPPTIPQRLFRLMVQPWRLPGVVWRRIRPQKGALVRQFQRYKGVRG